MLPDTIADHLPLTPVAFEILLAIGSGERHGYAIMRAVEERTNGRFSLHPGTLYRAIDRMTANGLLEEGDERPDPDLDDQRRRAYFRLTPMGHAVARAEAERLAEQVNTARARDFLQGGS